MYSDDSVIKLYSYFQIDRPLAKKLHEAGSERTTCGPQYFMMRVRTAVEPTPAASPITAEDVKLEVRISPPKSAPRDFFCEGPIDLKVAAILATLLYHIDYMGYYKYNSIISSSHTITDTSP